MARTKVYIFDVNELKDKARFEEGYALVNENRKRKIDRYVHEKDRLLSLGAGLLIRHFIIKEGLDYNTSKLLYSEWGKPHVDKHGYHFSLSHSGNYVLFATSAKHVGCDIEEIDKADDKIAKRIFSQTEYEIYKDGGNDFFYRFWTLKESTLKLKGVGLEESLDKYKFFGEVLSDYFSKEIDEEETYYRIYDELKGYIISVASIVEKIDDIRQIYYEEIIDRG